MRPSPDDSLRRQTRARPVPDDDSRRAPIPGFLCAEVPSSVTTGRWAESIAADYLSFCGFSILARNFRDGPRELDLLAVQGTWAVVVEVRFRSGTDRGRPEETIDRRKRMQLLRAGQTWWLREGRRFGPLRFDLVTIELVPRGLRLRHHPHFFIPDRMSRRR